MMTSLSERAMEHSRTFDEWDGLCAGQLASMGFRLLSCATNERVWQHSFSSFTTMADTTIKIKLSRIAVNPFSASITINYHGTGVNRAYELRGWDAPLSMLMPFARDLAALNARVTDTIKIPSSINYKTI